MVWNDSMVSGTVLLSARTHAGIPWYGISVCPHGLAPTVYGGATQRTTTEDAIPSGCGPSLPAGSVMLSMPSGHAIITYRLGK